jgi:hypothetical protein
MPQNAYAKLAALKKEVAALEAQLSRGNRKLLALPAKHGFKSMDAFIDALRAASGSTGGKSAATKAHSGRKPRAKITPETKSKVKELVKADKTGAEIAKTLGISLPSVQNIKKELGLVKARK